MPLTFRQPAPTPTWADDLADCLRRLRDPARDTVVLLDPCEAGRRRRWTRILAWHTTRSAPAAAGPRDLIVGIGEEFGALSAAFAERHGRPYAAAATAEAATGLVRDAASLLLVAPPTALDHASLARLASDVTVPWGVVTAHDAAGLTFALAKAEVGAMPSPTSPMVTVDALTGEIRESSGEDPRTRPRPLDAPTVMTIARGNWGVVSLMAHGDGGHLDLDEVVVCGLAGDLERTADGRSLPGGCRAAHGAPTCRRGDPARPRRTVAAGAIRTTHLSVHSCASFAAAGEPARTNVSTVLAAAEGYASSVLATSRIAGFEPWEQAIVWGCLREGAGLGAATLLLNRLHARREPAPPPYVLMGDPAGPPLRAAGTIEDGATLTITERCAAVIVETSPALAVAGFAPGLDGIHMLPLHDGLLVVRSRGDAAACLQVLDMSRRHAEQRATLAFVTRRIPRAMLLEAILADPALREQRLAVEDSVAEAVASCLVAGRHGGWIPAIDEHALRVAVDVSRWDRLAAGLGAAAFEALVLPDGPTTSWRRARCPSCGRGGEVRELQPALGGEPSLRARACRRCGRRAERAGERPLEVTRRSAGSVELVVPPLPVDHGWLPDGVAHLPGGAQRSLPAGRHRIAVPPGASEVAWSHVLNLTVSLLPEKVGKEPLFGLDVESVS